MFTNLIQTNLHTKVLGKAIDHFIWIESTNDAAWELVATEGPEGTVVITDNQTAGRGRSGRTWFSVPSKSLTASVILKPNMATRFSGWFPLLTGIAIADSLQELGLETGLKWPNDILVGGKKIGGILCESRVNRNTLTWLVIGIGLNINEQAQELPTELKATSFFVETGTTIQRELILAKILNKLEPLYDTFKKTHQIDDPRSRWLDYCVHLDQVIKYQEVGRTVKGIFNGLNNFGCAQIEKDGEKQTVAAGDIHLFAHDNDN